MFLDLKFCESFYRVFCEIPFYHVRFLSTPAYICPMQQNVIRYKKPIYPVNVDLENYLSRHTRCYPIPLEYEDLMHFSEQIPKLNDAGNPTLWYSVMFNHAEINEIYEKLVDLYQVLIADGSHLDYLKVDAVDFCMYGNSQPFRIKILNQINDNYDYYYIKKADASRIYGLELEQHLSPNNLNFIFYKNTLVEEHTIGIPGDDFIEKLEKHQAYHAEVRLAKEFVKFNERCFVRLLGDMRAYNFVIVINQDFDSIQYRIRCIDFDQQCYEGRRRIYLPQFYKENLPYVKLTQRNMSIKTAAQYVTEEQALIRKRYRLASEKLQELLAIMKQDTLSTPENIRLLSSELTKFYNNPAFEACHSMGELLELNILTRLNLT